ncbi:MAG: peptidase M42 [Planctomycetota bacterium]
MPEEQFDFMRRLLGAPSPIGFEAAMTHGVLEPYVEEFMPEGWGIHRFRGNAGVVIDTAPEDTDALSVMVIGHADKIRMQVRHIGEDGKIWVNTDSFLPCTLVGHEVKLFSEDPEKPGSYRVLEGGTIEAIGAIHFADAEMRSGSRGLKAEMMYLELHLHGEKRKEQVEKLGIKAGDPIILDREIRRGFGEDTFYGAYLDNGLGTFVVAEVARVLAQEFKPDVVIGVDVSHDYEAAPGVGEKRFPPNKMGAGFTLAVGAIVQPHLNALIQEAAKSKEIPYQLTVVGRDTGTDAMAAVLASIDSAATSIGFPIRNMHTISECGHTADVLAAVHGVVALLELLDEKGVTADDFRNGHVRLDESGTLSRD